LQAKQGSATTCVMGGDSWGGERSVSSVSDSDDCAEW